MQGIRLFAPGCMQGGRRLSGHDYQGLTELREGLQQLSSHALVGRAGAGKDKREIARDGLLAEVHTGTGWDALLDVQLCFGEAILSLLFAVRDDDAATLAVVTLAARGEGREQAGTIFGAEAVQAGHR